MTASGSARQGDLLNQELDQSLWRVLPKIDIRDGRPQARKLGVIEASREDDLALLLDSARERAAALVPRPRLGAVRLRDEDDAVARSLPVDVVEVLGEVLAPECDGL